MTYSQFTNALRVELQGYFPPDTSIELHTIPKNNQVTLEGLTILESGFHMAPTIYLEEFYQEFLMGRSLPDIQKAILKLYYEFRPMEALDLSFFQDFVNLEDQIVYKLIHFERNKQLLEEIPHIPYLDLAIVFYCLLADSGSQTATILIRNSHMKLWNIQVEELYQRAKENTPRLLHPRLNSISQMMTNSEDPDIQEFFLHRHLDPEPFPIYVLTNKQRHLGAACLLYQELLEQIAKTLQDNFYIIPSSVHEVLLIPAKGPMVPKDFNQMIQDVNQTQVEPEEILSDHVYYYDWSEKQIVI